MLFLSKTEIIEHFHNGIGGSNLFFQVVGAGF